VTAALVLGACADAERAAPASTTSTGATATATAAGARGTPAVSSPPEAARALEHVRALSSGIGVREAGTPGERRAAEYIRDQLSSFGYRATIEAFQVEVPRDESTVVGAGNPIAALAMVGAPDGDASGRLVFVGVGRPEDLATRDLRGAIVLVNRGQIPFRDKALAAQQAGAVAVVVANNQPGRFRGTIAAGSPEVRIPVVGVTSEEAERLDALVAAGGSIAVRALRTGEPFESYNVAAVPADGSACSGYVGAHLDSVARAPGANDNASGTAGMLELARSQRLAGVCYLAFGAEELGLFGSKAFVRDHAVRDARFMLNLDMLGKLNGPEVVALASDRDSRELAERASRVASRTGTSIPAGTFPPFTSSDHASFSEGGVPAVTLHSGDDPEMHTPEDDLADIDVQSLDVMLRAAAAVLQDLAAG